MKTMRVKLLFFLSFFFLLFSTGERVQAEGGFTVTPAFQEVSIAGEQTQDFSVTVRNDTDTAATFRLSVIDFGNLDESGGIAFLGSEHDFVRRYGLASWMRPEADTITVAPGNTQPVRVMIENRDDLSPGGHYAAIVFESAEGGGTPTSGNRIGVRQVFTVLVFAKKKGGEIVGQEFLDQEWEHRLWSLPEKVKLRFRNTGNVHVVPRGTVRIIDPLGRVIREGVINEESALLLPESIRQFNTTLTDRRFPFLPGPYTLSLATRYDGQDDFVLAEEQFDFLPPLAILAVFAVTGLSWYAVRRQKNTGETRGASNPS